MPAGAAAAGISALGQVGGGIAAGKGAKAAAKLQAQTADKQLAQSKQYYDDSVARYQPEMAAGQSAQAIYNGLLGAGGDQAASQAAYDTFKQSSQYQNTLGEALASTNANAYASGLGRPGAALKALQDRAATIAGNSLQTYLGNLNTTVQTGESAKGAITAAATNSLAANDAAVQSAGAAQANASLATGAGWSKAIQNIGNIAANQFKSSYGS